MPAGATAIQPWTPTVYTAQVAAAYKTNLDNNSSIASTPAGCFYVYPNNPAGMSVLVDAAFNLWALNGAGLNGGPILFNTAASPVTVSLVAPTSNSYYATIYWNPTTNTAGVAYGVASATPFPILPDNYENEVLAVVLLTTGQVSVQANNIFDARSFFKFGPVRFYTNAFAASVAVNCAGATVVTIDWKITTGGFVLSLTNLQIGIPVYMITHAGAPTATITPTTPSGVTYTTQTKNAGVAANFVNINPWSSGSGASYLNAGCTMLEGATPFLSMPFQ
jgi:hypothetical protein